MSEWTQDTTQGYTDDELTALNAELAALLQGIEPQTDEWWRVCDAFADEVSKR